MAIIKKVEFNSKYYPVFQTNGYASRFAKPFFDEICKGTNGVEVGCNREEWAFMQGSILIDPVINKVYSAICFPDEAIDLDWIASSHMLEHYIGRWQDVLEYWYGRLKSFGGVIFLYLPDMSKQKYWAWGNKKHVHYFIPELLREFCEYMQWPHIISGNDLNDSFYCIIEK